LYGKHRSRERKSAISSAQTRDLQTGAPGIHIGAPLPAVLVWSAEGDRAFEVRQLLPEGGIILLVSPGCDVCITAAVQMQMAVASLGVNEAHAILLTKHAAGGGQLRDTLRARGVNLEVYCDVQESFLREHHVAANPAFLALDKDGIVLDFGAGVPDGAQLVRIFAMSH
jgi:hypothetical protein